MLLYYVPEPSQAYPTTLFIFQNVSYGRFLESVHLYTAYAMIMLTFMHLMRGYFVSVHKKPREIMWMTGMFMGFVTLGLGFTGYLLPWTVVSKSATDVGAGLISALPQPVSSFLTFLIVGGGGDATELLRFFDLHVLVLPAILLLMLVVKMYMLEAHGVAEPAAGPHPVPQMKARLIPIFPDVSFYLAELAALFGAAMLLISVLFPLTLPPEYSASAASTYTAQPDWYFLWVYQVVKFAVFEANGPLGSYGLPIALSLISLVFILLFLLPFIDRGKTRQISRRPLFVSLGGVLVAEMGVLTVWGYLTPGSAIPSEQAVAVLGGAAVAVLAFSLTAYKLLFGSLRKKNGSFEGRVEGNTPNSRGISAASLIVVFVGLGTFFTGSTVNALVTMTIGGISLSSLEYFCTSLLFLSLTVLSTCYLLYRLDLGTGAIRRRIKAFEVGWKE